MPVFGLFPFDVTHDKTARHASHALAYPPKPLQRSWRQKAIVLSFARVQARRQIRSLPSKTGHRTPRRADPERGRRVQVMRFSRRRGLSRFPMSVGSTPKPGKYVKNMGGFFSFPKSEPCPHAGGVPGQHVSNAILACAYKQICSGNRHRPRGAEVVVLEIVTAAAVGIPETA